MNKEIVYVAGKITGDKKYKQKFYEADWKLREMGYENVVLPTCLSHFENFYSWEQFMNVCFAFIENADIVYMLKDWKDSKGACKEHSYALELDKKIIYEKD